MNEIVIPQWVQVRAHVESEIRAAHARLESPAPTREQDLLTKGEIRALKRLLDLPETLAAQQSQMAPPGWPGGTAS